MEALNRVYSELCISHQLLHHAMGFASRPADRERLQSCFRVIEDAALAVNLLRGQRGDARAEELAERGEMGYGAGSVGSDDMSLRGALGGLLGELHIARHQTALAEARLESEWDRLMLHRRGLALDALRAEVEAMWEAAG